jgi:EAL domain-containing protein (putative c-di-GMP-specific phosphodiesterase class I)
MKGERVTRDGMRLWVTSRAFPIRDLNGEVIGMSLVSHDISEEVRKEEKSQSERERQHWCDLIEQSLESDGFVFWGQPVFHTGSPVISHYELLIRMVRDGRVFMPDHFLGHAEDSGMIAGIDRWAVRNGIRLSQQIPVAVNLSGRALTDPNLIDYIGQSFDEQSADPSRIRFEITETSAIENLHDACLTVKALKALGCLVSLDDFGTGYSSFTYLKNLPVDELKIDRSFVSDLASSDSSRQVVESMVATARNFEIGTVAEGVEDEATAAVINQLGIDLSQGFFLGRPAPLDDVVDSEDRPHIATA